VRKRKKKKKISYKTSFSLATANGSQKLEKKEKKETS
jgi:hypothetical protein